MEMFVKFMEVTRVHTFLTEKALYFLASLRDGYKDRQELTIYNIHDCFFVYEYHIHSILMLFV